MLKDRFANLDELNYLARRMESFDYHEYDQFLIGSTKLENPTEKDLINLTFNLDHFTLCKDVSSYGKIGREYVMNTEGAVPAHDEDDPKYAAIGKDLIDRGLAQITAKGLLIYNPFDELEEVLNFNKKSRLADMLGRAVCFLGEFQSGEELYDTLSDQIGLTDDEIREIGFKSLVPFFNRDYYAQTIAEYLIDEGTDKTHSGNYHFSFAEVNERFGTSLPGDKEMLDKIVSSLDSEIVADVDATEDFDLTFYLDYCPYAEDGEELEDTPTQQM